MPRRFHRATAAAVLLAVCVAALHAISNSDDFNRTNEDPLSNGGCWANPIANAEGNFQVSGNSASPDGVAIFSVMRWATGCGTYSNDQQSQITLAGTPGGVNYGGVAVRVQPAAQTAYIFLSSAGVYLLQELTAGTAVTLATCTGTPATSDVLKINAVGTLITGYVNGSEAGTCHATDGTLTSGQPGIIGYGLLALDNWSAADVGGGGGGGGSATGGLLLRGVGE